ncbi:preprotein translocase subunit SecE [Thiococcus pfennigii]|jgi:preprotein translocase subunit SecE|uniref:preprotein translocase subunit SecE n=1 Tax=Thiococcus pfennigii TaxID=1057 RepID=UPI001906B021|nr:preprotein translocase subunit SecE [Thiococcus pfennigii]MBK1701623.1 preprotein translocase subunit SecE [Thiococcus pfennigii]MBK1731063.1 preprotein translocase subunit SecE [Thiococcus pfennigii]
MNARAEASGGRLDTIKLAVAGALLAGGIFAFYFFADYSTLLRVIGLLVIGGGAAVIALRTAQGRRLWQFIGDSRTEVRKVVWPTRQETIQTTLVVMAMVLVLGIILWLFDSVLMALVRFLVGRGG